LDPSLARAVSMSAAMLLPSCSPSIAGFVDSPASDTTSSALKIAVWCGNRATSVSCAAWATAASMDVPGVASGMDTPAAGV
jgi:hypothetical protein